MRSVHWFWTDPGCREDAYIMPCWAVRRALTEEVCRCPQAHETWELSATTLCDVIHRLWCYIKLWVKARRKTCVLTIFTPIPSIHTIINHLSAQLSFFLSKISSGSVTSFYARLHAWRTPSRSSTLDHHYSTSIARRHDYSDQDGAVVLCSARVGSSRFTRSWPCCSSHLPSLVPCIFPSPRQPTDSP